LLFGIHFFSWDEVKFLLKEKQGQEAPDNHEKLGQRTEGRETMLYCLKPPTFPFPFFLPFHFFSLQQPWMLEQSVQKATGVTQNNGRKARRSKNVHFFFP